MFSLCINVPISGLDVSLSHLEKALHRYTLSDCISPFDIKTVPKTEEVLTTGNFQGRNEKLDVINFVLKVHVFY